MLKRIIASFLFIFILFAVCCCSPIKDAPIDSEWVFVKLTMDGEVTTKNDIEDLEDAPKFAVIDEERCVFTLLGKDHPGFLEEEDGVYYVSFDDGKIVGERALKITIKADVMTIEFIPIDCTVIMRVK